MDMNDLSPARPSGLSSDSLSEAIGRLARERQPSTSKLAASFSPPGSYNHDAHFNNALQQAADARRSMRSAMQGMQFGSPQIDRMMNAIQHHAPRTQAQPGVNINVSQPSQYQPARQTRLPQTTTVPRDLPRQTGPFFGRPSEPIAAEDALRPPAQAPVSSPRQRPGMMTEVEPMPGPANETDVAAANGLHEPSAPQPTGRLASDEQIAALRDRLSSGGGRPWPRPAVPGSVYRPDYTQPLGGGQFSGDEFGGTVKPQSDEFRSQPAGLPQRQPGSQIRSAIDVSRTLSGQFGNEEATG